MPEFAHPVCLLLLVLAPLAAWGWTRRRGPALRWPAVTELTGLPAGRTKRSRIVGATLRGLGVAALVIASAGPRWPDRGSRLPIEGIAIQVVLDVSGSMAEPDFDWDGATIPRLDAAKRALRKFLTGRTRDQIGLIAFAAQPDDAAPLTLSHDVLMQLLDEQQPRGPVDTGTNIGDAVAWGLKRLDAAGNTRKVMVLLSDGEHNAPAPALTPRQAAQLAAHGHVTIYTIDAGPPPSPDAKPDDVAARKTGQQSLAAVATMTGGASFVAHDSTALRDALAAIDRLERAPIESFQYRRYAESFPVWAATALACFALALGLEATIWRRTP